MKATEVIKLEVALKSAKHIGKCAICGEDVWEYEAIEIGNKVICSGCGEAIYYDFRKNFREESFLEPNKEWVNEMERRLREGGELEGIDGE